MVSEENTRCQTKEQTFLFTKIPLTVVKRTEVERETSKPPENPVNDEDTSKETFNMDEQIEVAGDKLISITVWRNRKININTHLIPLRVAQLIWFASGGIHIPFFSLMLTYRGFKLSEFSSVFSMLFPLQLLVAYISGIIADKLGNAKPVLLFLILSTTISLVSMLSFPDIKDKHCLEQDANISCLTVFNCSSNSENCNHVLSTKVFSTEKDNNSCNVSSLSFEDKLVLNNSEILENASYLNSTEVFCNEMCSRFGESTNNCTFSSKNTYKMIFLALVLSFFSSSSTVYRFFDFAAINLAKKHKSHFGKERIFAICGSFLATLTCNFVLNIDKSKEGGYYINVYYFVVLLQVLSLLSSWKIRKFMLPPGLKLTKKTLMLFTNVEIVCMIIIAFVAGTGYAFNTFYDLWFLNSLKASKITIGFSIMTYSFYSFPIYATSEWWLRNLGQKKIVILALLSYTICAISYSFLYYPWLSLIIDVAKAFYFHLFWVALVSHCEKIAPAGFAATVNAVVGTVHFGIGRSFSIAVGGYLISRFGARVTFRILAAFCFVTAIVYSLFLYLRHWYCKRNRKNGTLHSLSSSVGNISSVLLPLIVGYLTEGKQTIEQWNKVFFIGIGVVMVTKTIFVAFGSCKIQPWNFVKDDDEKKEQQPEKEKKYEDTRF